MTLLDPTSNHVSIILLLEKAYHARFERLSSAILQQHTHQSTTQLSVSLPLSLSPPPSKHPSQHKIGSLRRDIDGENNIGQLVGTRVVSGMEGNIDGNANAEMARPQQFSWPDLVNTNVDAAVALISSQNPGLLVQKVPQGSMVTMDFREDRVRVYYDTDTNQVTRPPNIG